MLSINLSNWKDIEDDFLGGSLILGNGASAAINQSFLYGSLREVANQNGFITPQVQSIFDLFNTQDFELVLRMISNAQNVNRLLSVSENTTPEAYNSVREALVKAVNKVHPSFREINDYLPPMISFMKNFRTVISLNYDLLVYWAMLTGNRTFGRNTFKDCFIGGFFRDDFQFLRQPYRNQPSTLIFYPHGNLVLANQRFGTEIKITNNDDSYLLDTITSKWQTGQYTPLFVSEGTNTQKLEAIRRNGYLRTIYNTVLPSLGEKIVIYGWSLSKVDDHILRAIARGRVNKIAISVYTNLEEDMWKDYCYKANQKIKRYLQLRDSDITFFDSSSEDCWINSSTRLETVEVNR